jgi:hypothetical protein
MMVSAVLQMSRSHRAGVSTDCLLTAHLIAIARPLRGTPYLPGQECGYGLTIGVTTHRLTRPVTSVDK